MKKSLISLSFVFFLFSCASTPPAPALTPAEIQSIQTRQYDESKDIVFASVVSVFQDLGYQIAAADLATGIITSQSAAANDAAYAFWTGVAKNTQTKATAFVETIGTTTSVRLNFVTSTNESFGYGQQRKNEQPVTDSQIYQNAFEKVENAIFMRSSK
ncbi:hypothetical protein N9I79_05720 [Gammaproteobacteria bacterium]|nr:hypothetical protein [Gammaproteobacteria bacterium]|tara:strand:+ start:635 stop:1108 length:474 start_codon:yes stop_codon:yes gene_type:complete